MQIWQGPCCIIYQVNVNNFVIKHPKTKKKKSYKLDFFKKYYKRPEFAKNKVCHRPA